MFKKLVIIFAIVFLGFSQVASALDGNFYFAWGYNREKYSRSDIHYKSNDGDSVFVVKKARAHDRSNFSKIWSGL